MGTRPLTRRHVARLLIALTVAGAIVAGSNAAYAECPRAAELRKAGELDDAEQVARECVEARPDNADDLLELANVLAARGDYDEALTYLDRAEAQAPDYLAVDLQRIRVLAWSGDSQAALGELEALPAEAFEDESAKLLRAQVNLWAGKYQQAVSWFDRYLEQVPERPTARYGRGAALVELGRDEQAVEDLEFACDEGISDACDLAREARRDASPSILSSTYVQGEYSLVQDRDPGWSILGQLTFEPLRNWTITPSVEVRTRPFPDTSLTDVILELDTRFPIAGPLELAGGGGWAPNASFFPDWNAYIEPHIALDNVDVGLRYWHIQFDETGVEVINPMLTVYLGNWYLDGRYYMAIETDEITHAGLARAGYSLGDWTFVAGAGAGNRSDFVELRRTDTDTQYHWLALGKAIWAFHPRQRASLEVVQRVDVAGERDYIQTQFMLGYKFLF
ncbi:MAG: tetratricopeptide repeat protein [Myxococcota bacterium]